MYLFAIASMALGFIVAMHAYFTGNLGLIALGIIVELAALVYTVCFMRRI